MFAKKKPDDGIPEQLVVEKPQVIRLIFSEKHNVILKQITPREMSISEIARALEFNPGSVHYYLKELEKHGLARQVRQEIKGGVVKKYYRAAARRIVLASPDFEDPVFKQLTSSDELAEQLVRAIEDQGYQVPEVDREDAKDLVLRYDRLIKEIVKEIQNREIYKEDSAGLPHNLAHHLMIHIRALEDPELGRIYSQFCKLFLRLE